MTELRNLLKKLSLEFGLAGYESKIRQVIIDELSPYSDKFEAYIDNAGAYIVHIASEDKPKLMVSAHMDEVGFIVTDITSDGLIKFDEVGGIDRRVVPGCNVIINNKIN